MLAKLLDSGGGFHKFCISVAKLCSSENTHTFSERDQCTTSITIVQNLSTNVPSWRITLNLVRVCDVMCDADLGLCCIEKSALFCCFPRSDWVSYSPGKFGQSSSLLQHLVPKLWVRELWKSGFEVRSIWSRCDLERFVNLLSAVYNSPLPVAELTYSRTLKLDLSYLIVQMPPNCERKFNQILNYNH